jgi:hypothetical protein
LCDVHAASARRRHPANDGDLLETTAEFYHAGAPRAAWLSRLTR